MLPSVGGATGCANHRRCCTVLFFPAGAWCRWQRKVSQQHQLGSATCLWMYIHIQHITITGLIQEKVFMQSLPKFFPTCTAYQNANQQSYILYKLGWSQSPGDRRNWNITGYLAHIMKQLLSNIDPGEVSVKRPMEEQGTAFSAGAGKKWRQVSSSLFPCSLLQPAGLRGIHSNFLILPPPVILRIQTEI